MKKSRLNICGVYLCYEELRDLFNYDVLDAALSNVKMKRSSSQKYFGVGRARETKMESVCYKLPARSAGIDELSVREAQYRYTVN